MKKKTILSLFACCCAAFTACDMDLTSETSIATNESVQSVWIVRNTVICFMRSGVHICKTLMQWMPWFSLA